MLNNPIKEGWLTFKSIFTGMGITFRHLFSPAVTLQYPEEREILPDGARAKLFVNIDDCIGCNLCSRACPVNCIDIETVAATADTDLGKTSTGNPKRFWLTRFDIDMAKCMYCDLCVHPCPTNCIYMVPEYEYSEFDRTNLTYHFSNLTPEMITDVKEKAEAEAEEKKRQREEMMREKAELARKKKEEEAKADEMDPKGSVADQPIKEDSGENVKKSDTHSDSPQIQNKSTNESTETDSGSGIKNDSNKSGSDDHPENNNS